MSNDESHVEDYELLHQKFAQSTTNICHVSMCMLHVSTSTQPSSRRSATEKNNVKFFLKFLISGTKNKIPSIQIAKHTLTL